MSLTASGMSVADLVAHEELALSVSAAGTAGLAPVGSPLVIESLHPGPHLVGGELLMTTGSLLGSDATAWTTFLTEASAAGAVGVVLRVSDPSSAPLDTLQAVATDLGLPLLTAPETTPFGLIARTISAERTATDRTIVRESFELQMELTGVVARGGDIDDLLRCWHRRMDEAVAVFDRLGRLVDTSDGFEPATFQSVSATLRADPPRLGERRRSPEEGEDAAVLEITPFAGTDTVRGYLVRRDSGRRTASSTTPALCAMLALEFERRWFLDEPSRRQRAERFARLLSISDEARAQAFLRGMGVDPTELWGVAVDGGSEINAEVLVDDLAVVLSTPLLRINGSVVECLSARDPQSALHDFGLTSPIGIGTPASAGHAARTMRQATLALATSRRVGAPIQYVDGSAHEFLIQIASPDYLDAFADAVLAPIERVQGGDVLLRTLHTWLIERRSVEAAADRMGVHRHTVRNRMQRIEQLTGHSLESIDAQTELWLAFKARGFRDEAERLAE